MTTSFSVVHLPHLHRVNEVGAQILTKQETLMAEIQKVPIHEIIIGSRARIDLGNLDELTTSIKNQGLINPICITRDKRLIAGRRRLAACKNLGMTEVDAKYYEDMSLLGLKTLEHDENIYKYLTWYEASQLRADVHKLNQEKYGMPVKGHDSEGQSLEKTAAELGITKGMLSIDIALANAVKDMPKLKSVQSKRQALKTINKLEERAVLTELATRAVSKVGTNMSIPYITYNGDAIEIIKNSLDTETIDLIIIDPPYGIDINTLGGGKGRTAAPYDDTPKKVEAFTENIIPELHRVLKNNCHMYFFFPICRYEYYYNLLLQHFIVEQVPLIWVKESGGYTNFDMKFMPKYEAFFFCSKGIRSLSEPVSNVFEYSRTCSRDRLHPMERPIELISRLIKLSSVKNEVILDPCAGSFVTGVAATLMGRQSISIELNTDTYNTGIERLKGVTKKNDTQI